MRQPKVFCQSKFLCCYTRSPEEPLPVCPMDVTGTALLHCCYVTFTEPKESRSTTLSRFLCNIFLECLHVALKSLCRSALWTSLALPYCIVAT